MGYFAGPQPQTPVYNPDFPTVPDGLAEVESFVENREQKTPTRNGCEARIIWADSINTTSCVFLYLHGFSACKKEGDPVHYNIARYFGANLYLSRLAGHGLKPSLALEDFNPEGAWESAKEELAIAEKLGKKVIIVSTSTGSTLALKLAADFPDKVHALINLSPNYRIKNPLAPLLNDPWGKQLTYLTYGPKRHVDYDDEESKLYWDTTYTINALVQLQELMETIMIKETYEKVKCPVLSIYYYKNEEEQDDVVDVSVIPEIHKQLASPAEQNKYIALTTPGNHVIGSYIKSKDYQSVETEIIKFSENTLGLEPAKQNSAKDSVAKQGQ